MMREAINAVNAVRTMFMDREIVHDQNREYSSYANLKNLNYIIGFFLDNKENVVYYNLTKIAQKENKDASGTTRRSQ